MKSTKIIFIKSTNQTVVQYLEIKIMSNILYKVRKIDTFYKINQTHVKQRKP